MRLSFFIDEFFDWRQRRAAVAELRRLKRQDEPFEAYEIEVLLNAIKAAAFCEDSAGTLKAFNNLRDRAPHVAIQSAEAIRSLMAVGKRDVAESALEEGLRKNPGVFTLMVLYAEIASRRGDWTEANRRWKLVRQRYPDDIWAYYWGAISFSENGQYDEADKLLERALAKDPSQPVCAAEYARVAERRGDHEEALHRWNLMRDRVEDQSSWVGSARSMRQLGQVNEAIDLLERARRRFPSRPEPLMELAEVYSRRGPIEKAAGIWQSLREQFPHMEQGYTYGARSLLELGREDEANAVLQRYADRQLQQSRAAD